MIKPSFGDMPVWDGNYFRLFKLPNDGADWQCRGCPNRFAHNKGCLVLNVTESIHANLCDSCIKQKLGPDPILVEPTHVWEKLIRARRAE